MAYAKGSFFSVCVGWLPVMLFAFPVAIFSEAGFIIAAYLALVYALINLVVWLLIFWPLYCYVPRRSALWRWPICTVCGLGGGTLIALFIFGCSDFKDVFEHLPTVLPFCLLLGGIVGAVTCLTASLTANYFLGPPPPPDPLPVWVQRTQDTPSERRFSLLADSARQWLEKMLRWVSARFTDLSGQ